MLGPFTRVFAFFGKWTAEVIRQPALMLSLVVGPFLVLLAFGRGVEVFAPEPTAIVVDETTGDASQELPAEVGEHVEVIETTDDLQYALGRLREGDVNAVAVIPEGSMNFVERGERIPLRVYTNEIDPVARSFANSYLRDQVTELNRATIEQAVGEAQASAGDLDALTSDARGYVALMREARGDVQQMRSEVARLREALGPLSESVEDARRGVGAATLFIPGLADTSERVDELAAAVTHLRTSVDDLDRQLAAADGEDGAPSEAELAEIEGQLTEVERLVAEARTVPPNVLSAPFELQLESVTTLPSFTAFFAPAVLTLLVQHLAITLGALSMARVRLLGLTDLLRVAPVRATEVVLGNYLAYGVLCVIAAAALLGLMLWLLGVPVVGSALVLALTVGLLILVALGVGLVISILSSSEQQAAQLAMLVLLAAIFFSGFAFSLERVTWPVKALSFALPSTYGIRTLQDVMLRGVVRHPEDIVILGVAAVAVFALTVFLLRREFRPE